MELPDYLASGELARLIPVASDSGKEARAASILLATLMSVTPFSRVLLGSLGQRVGARTKLRCYTEVVFKAGADSSNSRPDGLLVVEGAGGRQWRCLIEAKIGRSELDADQVERYASLAKSQKIDAVLTISNQFVALATHTPVKVSKVALRGLGLFHWSWMYLITEAELLLSNHEFEQSDQRYILAEMVRYFTHPSMGVSTFDRMNSDWKDLNAQVQAGAKLARTSPAVENSVAAWHQEARDLCLLMTRKLDRSVRLRLSRAHLEDPAQWLRDDCSHLVDQNELKCVLDVPDAAAPIAVTADLMRRSINVSMPLTAPRDKQRATSRINWLVRQLSKTKSAEIHIRATWPGRAPPTQATLASIREDPATLLGGNTNLIPSQFEVILVRDIAGKFSGSKKFIEELEAAVPEYYAEAGQYLRAYIAPPPPLRKKTDAKQGIEEAGERSENMVSEALEETQSDAASGG